MYSSACVGSTSYFVVYAEVASQGENRQGAGIREGADQRYFTVIVWCTVGVYVVLCYYTTAVHACKSEGVRNWEKA